MNNNLIYTKPQSQQIIHFRYVTCYGGGSGDDYNHNISLCDQHVAIFKTDIRLMQEYFYIKVMSLFTQGEVYIFFS